MMMRFEEAASCLEHGSRKYVVRVARSPMTSTATATTTTSSTTTSSTTTTTTTGSTLTLEIGQSQEAAQEQQVDEFSYTLRGLRSNNEIAVWARDCCCVSFAYKVDPPPAGYFERHYYNDPDRNANWIRVAIYNENSINNKNKNNINNSNDRNAIAIDGDTGGEELPMIVASCRIFDRMVSMAATATATAATTTVAGDDSVHDIRRPTTIRVGGIGEVCTVPQHQHRGLAKQLLRDCLSIMSTTTTTTTAQKAKQHIELSLLHAAPTFFPVYQAAGYTNIKTAWSQIVVTMQQSQSPSSSSLLPSSWYIRLAAFPNDTMQLMPIHQRYSEQRFVGCIVRSEQYWNEYLSQELCGSLFVLVEVIEPSTNFLNGNDDDNSNNNNSNNNNSSNEPVPRIVGWMSIRSRGIGPDGIVTIQLREFGCTTEPFHGRSALELIYPIFETLLHHAVSELDVLLSSSDDKNNADAKVSTRSIQLLLPTAILKDVETSFQQTSKGDTTTDRPSSLLLLDWDHVAVKDDFGWMYQSLPSTPSSSSSTLFEQNRVDDKAMMQTPLPSWLRNGTHLIWPSDSF